MNNGSLRIRMGTGAATVTAGPSEVWFYTNDGKSRSVTGKQVPLADAADLVLHLVEELPIFSDAAYKEVLRGVNQLKVRRVQNRKVKDLMLKLSLEHFDKDLSELSGNHFDLVRLAAEAQIDLAEAEAKLK